uniref:Uncharacterized protein n=1 Tax=Pygocentrus nattereri TaxID=42514 RepID=A0AAR2JRD2_PYGNA
GCKNVPQHKIAQTLNIPPSTAHNMIRRLRESGEMPVHKGQSRRSVLDARDLRALPEIIVAVQSTNASESCKMSRFQHLMCVRCSMQYINWP